MTPDFNACDPATWPFEMTIAHVAQIFTSRTAGGIKKACELHRFTPAPFARRPQYVWRKADVLRALTGPRELKRRKGAA